MFREMGFRKGEEFYIALGQQKISTKTVVNNDIHRLKEGDSAVEPQGPAAELLQRREQPRKTTASSTYGIKVEGIDDVMLQLAKCCRPVPGDAIVGYISLGIGITIHHEDSPNASLKACVHGLTGSKRSPRTAPYLGQALPSAAHAVRYSEVHGAQPEREPPGRAAR